MAYDGRIMRRALGRFEEDRTARQESFARRREQVFARRPRLRQIEQELGQTMSRIISGALRRGTDPRPAIETLRDENLSLQREKREILQELGLPEDYLEEKPACALCGDTGYRGGEVCLCLRRYYAREQQKELSRMLDLGSQSFDTFSLEWYSDRARDGGVSPQENMKAVYDVCAEYAYQFGKKPGNLLLFGAPGFRNRGDGVVDAFNRAYLIAPNGVGEGWYDKEHLVPFGEYVPPFLDLPFLRPLLQGVGEFLPGESTGPLVLPATPQLSPDRGPLVLGVLICYESIFPELARKQVAQGATLLVNISNDAWFGRSSAPEQHLSLGILRAVEQRRWIARSTNTGISAFVDPTGAVVARSGLFKAESLSHPVVPLTEKSVFFTLEPWLPWAGLALFLTFFAPVLSRFRRHI